LKIRSPRRHWRAERSNRPARKTFASRTARLKLKFMRRAMFEDSTFESTGRIRTRSRRWMMAAFLFNGSMLLALVLIPLMYPEALPQQMMNILLEAPRPPAPQPKPVVQQAPAQAFHGAPLMDGMTLVAPRRIPRDITMISGPEAPVPTFFAMDAGPDAATGIRQVFQGRGASVAPGAPTGPVRLPSVLAAGMVLEKVLPVYPAFAKAAHVEGTVVLQAMISRLGTVENLRVISGHPMLQQAAMDAVHSWRYRPYLLNGQPVEVETTVNVIFKMTQ
jgi:protein TonB